MCCAWSSMSTCRRATAGLASNGLVIVNPPYTLEQRHGLPSAGASTTAWRGPGRLADRPPDGRQRLRLRREREETPMMVLHISPTSPFSRKVRIAADMLGMSDCIEVVMTDTLDPSDRIRIHNPLGKIPALVLDDGPVLYDSRVIVEYLDHRAGDAKLIPAPSDARFRVKTEEALADGLMDAGRPAGLRRPLSRRGAARAEMVGLPGRQGEPRARRLRTAHAGRTPHRGRHFVGLRARLSRPAASPVRGEPTTRGSSAGSPISRKKCRPSPPRASKAERDL